jgi:hypothetical protein
VFVPREYRTDGPALRARTVVVPEVDEADGKNERYREEQSESQSGDLAPGH